MTIQSAEDPIDLKTINKATSFVLFLFHPWRLTPASGYEQIRYDLFVKKLFPIHNEGPCLPAPTVPRYFFFAPAWNNINTTRVPIKIKNLLLILNNDITDQRQ